MNLDLIDEPEEISAADSALENTLFWWKKKRIWYNITVGLSGILPLLIYAKAFNFVDFIGLVIYAFVLNVFYSSGFILESLNFYYLQQRFQIDYLRIPLFIFGTLVSCAITFTWALIYYSWHPF